MTKQIRVMLVDDHAALRTGCRCLIEKMANARVVAEAESGVAAYRSFKECAPDVIVMDLSMPGQSGIETIRHIRQRDPHVCVLIYTMHQNAVFAAKAMEAGARGYVTKSSPPDMLIHALFEVASGRRSLSPDISHELALSKLDAPESRVDELSPREFEIFRLLVQEKTAKEIGEILNVSPKTVANYHYEIKRKFGVASDIGLIRMALQLGIAEVPASDFATSRNSHESSSQVVG